MRSEFLALFKSHRINDFADGCAPTCGRLSEKAGGRTAQKRDFHALRLAFEQLQKCAFASGADKSLSFPVADTVPANDDVGPLRNICSGEDPAATGGIACTPVIAFAPPPQTAPDVAAITLVSPKQLIDTRVAQGDILFGQPAADLFRRPSRLT